MFENLLFNLCLIPEESQFLPLLYKGEISIEQVTYLAAAVNIA